MLTEQEREDIIEGVYVGAITLHTLPTALYTASATDLFNSVQKGWGKAFAKIELDTNAYVKLDGFRKNINAFSGAKTFQEVKDLQNLILDKNGVPRPYNEYLKDAVKIDDLYNGKPNWLAVERDTAFKVAENARYWQDIEKQKDILPYLQYRTMRDNLVREEHKALDGLTAKVDDPIWNTYSPPNGYRCRCILIQLESAKLTDQSTLNLDEINKEVPELFRFNAGKNGVDYIYKETGRGIHPYFKVDQRYKVLKENNFNLPLNFNAL